MKLLMLRAALRYEETCALHPLGDYVLVDYANRPECSFCGCWGDPCFCDKSFRLSLSDPWSEIVDAVYDLISEKRVRERLIRVEEAVQVGDRGWGDLVEHFERHGFRIIDEDSQRPALAAAGIIDGEFREAS